MLTDHPGVKKRDEIQRGMKRRRMQGRDGLTGGPQKRSKGNNQKSRKCVQEKRFGNFGVFREKSSWEGNFKTLNV